MLNTKHYSKSKKLQDSAFVQLKNPETGTPETTEKGEKIGFEVYSMHSKEFKRALRSTADFDLTKQEKDRHAKIQEWISEGTKPSEENLDFLDYCDEKVADRMQRVFALTTKKLHNITLTKEDADELGIKISRSGNVIEDASNIHKLYSALPDLSTQIGDSIAVKENFTKS